MSEENIQNVDPATVEATHSNVVKEETKKEFVSDEQKAFEPGKVASNFNKLKEQAPDLHELMMDSIAQRIVDDMKKGQERMKAAWRGNA